MDVVEPVDDPFLNQLLLLIISSAYTAINPQASAVRCERPGLEKQAVAFPAECVGAGDKTSLEMPLPKASAV